MLKGPATILIADDSEDDRFMTERFVRLVQPTAEIVLCRDGLETLDCLLDYASGPIERMPHLAFLDLKMPKLNGDEVMERVREERSLAALPVVLFSSSALESDVERCLRSGVRSYVRKPTDFDEYRTVIDRICSYWLQVNVNLRNALVA